ncbi:MAG: hypothetical protein L6416_06945, partial [Candidatus Omnitrophica bacterium]|nr:hypothetical protein [Candidatus Omnitrophota bacterium]
CPAIQADTQVLLNNFAIIYEREAIKKPPVLKYENDLITKQNYFRNNLSKIKGAALLLMGQCILGLPLYVLTSANATFSDNGFYWIFLSSLLGGILGGAFISFSAFFTAAREYIGNIKEKHTSKTIPLIKDKSPILKSIVIMLLSSAFVVLNYSLGWAGDGNSVLSEMVKDFENTYPRLSLVIYFALAIIGGIVLFLLYLREELSYQPSVLENPSTGSKQVKKLIKEKVKSKIKEQGIRPAIVKIKVSTDNFCAAVPLIKKTGDFDVAVTLQPLEKRGILRFSQKKYKVDIEIVPSRDNNSNLKANIRGLWKKITQNESKMNVTSAQTKGIVATEQTVNKYRFFESAFHSTINTEAYPWHNENKVVFPFNPQEFNFTKLYENINPAHLIDEINLNGNIWYIGVNNAPIFENHMLIVPKQAKAQVIREQDFLDMNSLLIKLNDPKATLLHNSLLAGPRFNSFHMHLHFYDFPIFNPEFAMYPGTEKFASLVFKGKEYVNKAAKFINSLYAANQPFNVIMKLDEIIIIPRPSDLEFNFSAQDLAGTVFYGKDRSRVEAMSISYISSPVALLNAQDSTFSELKADLLLLCGNYDIETFKEALRLYNAKKINKILIAGGYGSCTFPLFEAAQKAGFDFEIDEGVFITPDDDLRNLRLPGRNGTVDLEALNNQPDRTEYKKIIPRSESEIINQIMRVLAKQMNVSLDENDIYLETDSTNTAENFELAIPYIKQIKHDLAKEEITVAYMQTPHLQFRAKATFNRFKKDWKNLGVKGISYTIDWDVSKLTQDEIIEKAAAELWRLIIYTAKGDLMPLYGKDEGLDSIPDEYWKRISQLVSQLNPSVREKVKKGLYDLSRTVKINNEFVFASENGLRDYLNDKEVVASAWLDSFINFVYSQVKIDSVIVEIYSMENVKGLLESNMKISEATAYDLKSNISINSGLVLMRQAI